MGVAEICGSVADANAGIWFLILLGNIIIGGGVGFLGFKLSFFIKWIPSHIKKIVSIVIGILSGFLSLVIVGVITSGCLLIFKFGLF